MFQLVAMAPNLHLTHMNCECRAQRYICLGMSRASTNHGTPRSTSPDTPYENFSNMGYPSGRRKKAKNGYFGTESPDHLIVHMFNVMHRSIFILHPLYR